MQKAWATILSYDPGYNIGEPVYLASEVDALVKWCISNGVVRNYVHGGFHSLVDDLPITPPAEFEDVLNGLMERSPHG